ncbi:hypothetical protein ACIP39_24520 [Streptomyces tibetensis]|uniref:hypothetical protein n=1 Tax=Streptomyces tibetensis TaxID=2382123 RepID=UPI00380E6ED6
MADEYIVLVCDETPHDVLLTNPGAHVMDVVQVVRRLTGLSFWRSKVLVTRLPAVVPWLRRLGSCVSPGPVGTTDLPLFRGSGSVGRSPRYSPLFPAGPGAVVVRLVVPRGDEFGKAHSSSRIFTWRLRSACQMTSPATAAPMAGSSM